MYIVSLLVSWELSMLMQEDWCCGWASWPWLWLYKSISSGEFRHFRWKPSTLYCNNRGGCFRGGVWTKILWGLWACNNWQWQLKPKFKPVTVPIDNWQWMKQIYSCELMYSSIINKTCTLGTNLPHQLAMFLREKAWGAQVSHHKLL